MYIILDVKYQIQRWLNNMKQTKTIIIGTIILMFLFSTKPASGSTDDCEKLAVDYQTEYGGSLIFLNPLNDNGSYELCRYCGH